MPHVHQVVTVYSLPSPCLGAPVMSALGWQLGYLIREATLNFVADLHLGWELGAQHEGTAESRPAAGDRLRGQPGREHRGSHALSREKGRGSEHALLQEIDLQDNPGMGHRGCHVPVPSHSPGGMLPTKS